MTEFALTVKRKQILLMTAITLIILIVAFIVIKSLVVTATPVTTASQLEAKQIETAGKRLNPQEVWVEHMQNENKLIKEQLKQLEVLMTETIKQSAGKEQMIEYLEQELKELQTGAVSLSKTPALASDQPLTPSGQQFGHFPNEGAVARDTLPPGTTGGIKKIVLSLSPSSKSAKKNLKTVENTIPAGAYAAAVLIGGVDASTSINAQGDPRPVLLRLTDHGNLPRRFKSDLNACHVLASSYGDLSSERVYMRLEKLTCTEPLTGEIMETQVAGYITGEDGRAGVRGTVVDRAGEAIRNSLVGGFFSGLSQFLGAEQQRSVYPTSPFGQTNALAPQRILGAGAAQGAGNAMEKYAEFFIKRAEQLQPVIQVAAGRAVDIVFTQGTGIGDSSVKQALHRIREESRREAVDDLQSSPDDKQWLPPVSPSQGDHP